LVDEEGEAEEEEEEQQERNRIFTEFTLVQFGSQLQSKST
jgi:hypothetical protein